MVTWKYKIVKSHHVTETELDYYGRMGWELESSIQGDRCFVLIFKQQIIK